MAQSNTYSLLLITIAAGFVSILLHVQILHTEHSTEPAPTCPKCTCEVECGECGECLQPEVEIVTSDSGPPKLTIYTCPKPIKEPNQVLAVASWKRLHPKPEIILMGKDKEVEELAKQLEVGYYPGLKYSELGTPYVDDIMHKADQAATTNLRMLINSDIILSQSFMDAAKACNDKFKKFLMSGRRTNLKRKHDYDIADPTWIAQVEQEAKDIGKLFTDDAQDYFLYTKGFWDDINIPPFLYGRKVFDNWLINAPVVRNFPVIDATPTVLAIHLNHDYSHLKNSANAEKDNNGIPLTAEVDYNIQIGNRDWAKGQLRWASYHTKYPCTVDPSHPASAYCHGIELVKRTYQRGQPVPLN